MLRGRAEVVPFMGLRAQVFHDSRPKGITERSRARYTLFESLDPWVLSGSDLQSHKAVTRDRSPSNLHPTPQSGHDPLQTTQAGRGLQRRDLSSCVSDPRNFKGQQSASNFSGSYIRSARKDCEILFGWTSKGRGGGGDTERGTYRPADHEVLA